MKRIVVLGSTGSVGQQTLDVIRAYPDKFKVVGLAARTNQTQLSQQVDEFQPDMVGYSEELAPTPTLLSRKQVSMEEMAAHPDVDLVVIATVSALAGLSMTLAAIKAGKTVAMANQEVMIMAGPLLVETAKQHNASLLPVHGALSAVWQCLRGEPDPVTRVILTASEGPFVSRAPDVVTRAIRQEARAHPSWRMGKKARVDGMTLMTTGMQAILVNSLFGVPYEKIEVILHPEDVVRAMVEFVDGSVKAVLSQPTLHLTLQYALSYPERWHNEDVSLLDLVKVGQLTFRPLEIREYPCLASALAAGRGGGTAPAVLNAANEVAVLAFLSQQIGLNEVPKVISSVLNAHPVVPNPTLEDIIKADAWAREEAPRHTVV